MAPGEDPAGRAGQRPGRTPRGVAAPDRPAHAEDSRAQQQLAEGFRGARSGGGCAGCRRQGAGGRGQAGRCPAALPAAVGDQPGLGHVLAGGGRGAVRPATVVPAAVGAGAWGGRGRRLTVVGGTGPSSSPLPSPRLPWQPVSCETLLPARGRWHGEQVGICGGGIRGGGQAVKSRGRLGACARSGGARPLAPPAGVLRVPAHHTGPRCCS